MASQTAQKVDALLKKYGVSQIDIIAHSMGGIVGRYFVQMLGGDGLIRNLITLGTPHQGTVLSRYSLLPPVKELIPNSLTLKKLNRCAAPQVTQGLAISGNLDIVVRPSAAAHWKGVRNIHLKNVGHAGLLFSRRVFQLVFSRLS